MSFTHVACLVEHSTTSGLKIWGLNLSLWFLRLALRCIPQLPLPHPSLFFFCPFWKHWISALYNATLCDVSRTQNELRHGSGPEDHSSAGWGSHVSVQIVIQPNTVHSRGQATKWGLHTLLTFSILGSKYYLLVKYLISSSQDPHSLDSPSHTLSHYAVLSRHKQ